MGQIIGRAKQATVALVNSSAAEDQQPHLFAKFIIDSIFDLEYYYVSLTKGYNLQMEYYYIHFEFYDIVLIIISYM